MFKIIALFALAMFCSNVIALIVQVLLTLLIAPLMRRYRLLAPLGSFLIAACSYGVAMLVFVWISRRWGVQPWVEMFLLPYVFIFLNDKNRVKMAKEGTSAAALMCKESGVEYDSIGAIRGEYGSMAGDIVGFWRVYILAATALRSFGISV